MNIIRKKILIRTGKKYSLFRNLLEQAAKSQ